jgi:hypothetical protein
MQGLPLCQRIAPFSTVAGGVVLIDNAFRLCKLKEWRRIFHLLR